MEIHVWSGQLLNINTSPERLQKKKKKWGGKCNYLGSLHGVLMMGIMKELMANCKF